MLIRIAKPFRILAKGPAASNTEIEVLRLSFDAVPSEYFELVNEATELELQHEGGQYVRIWGPSGCLEMDAAYGIRRRIHDAIPIGDDGGGHVIFYANGKQGVGLYHVGFGNLDLDDAIWICGSLSQFLTKAVGVDTF